MYVYKIINGYTRKTITTTNKTKQDINNPKN